jgi:tetratricopeptide (TPR) repeat protein
MIQNIQDPELAQIETDIATAIDFCADGQDRRAVVLLEKSNQKLRLLSVGAHRVTALHLWALSLGVMEEWEQALLKYEQILSIDPADEDALWESAQILLRQLEKPESARTLLSERLLPISRLPEYVDALRECEAALGIEREKSET